MACENGYADANDFGTYFCIEIEQEHEARTNRLLQMASSNINVALQAVGACDCDYSDFAIEYLKNLNIVLTAVLYDCPCSPNLTVEEKRLYLEWATDNIAQIREGKLEMCDGYTGSEYPAIGWAEQAHTEFAAEEIIVNRVLRTGG